MITEVEAQILNTLQALFDRFGWLGVVGLTIFESATGFSSSEIFLSLAGWLLLAAHNAPEAMILVSGLYTALGSLAGASIPYWVARLGGRPLVEKILSWFRMDPRYITLAEQQFQRWGSGLVFFGRVIPVVRVMVNIPAGLVRMPFLKFSVFTFLGAYIWCTVFIGLGYTIGHQWPLITRMVAKYTPLVLIALVILVVVGFIARQRFHQRLRLQSILTTVDKEK